MSLGVVQMQVRCGITVRPVFASQLDYHVVGQFPGRSSRAIGHATYDGFRAISSWMVWKNLMRGGGIAWRGKFKAENSFMRFEYLMYVH